MVETHPGLVDDCNVRIFTGNDDLAAEIDPQYLIDINKLFPADQAESLKAAMGKTTIIQSITLAYLSQAL
jgi:methyl-coenzyme M reductase alpha subunit